MLTEREVQIAELLMQQREKGYLTAAAIARCLNVSLRTVQNEMRILKEELGRTGFARLENKRSKGCRLVVQDPESLQQYLADNAYASSRAASLATSQGRVQQLLGWLLFSSQPLTHFWLQERLHVSEATLTHDLKKAEAVLEKYNLAVTSPHASAVSIQGSEMDRRKCITHEHIPLEDPLLAPDYHMDEDTVKAISQKLVEVLKEHRYSINDVALQNLIAHINILLRRVQLGFNSGVGPALDEKEYETELAMAEEILAWLQQRYQISFTPAERSNLAMYFKGKRDYYDKAYITSEIDDFVSRALKEIEARFSVPLLDDLQLRISLSLHLLPLLERVRNHAQLDNSLQETVRRHFQMEYDMASVFAECVAREYGSPLIEGEISYLAIYFRIAVNNYRSKQAGKKVLLVSSLRKSESLLLKEMIYAGEGNRISRIDVTDPISFNTQTAEGYDLVLTMDETGTDRAGVLPISKYPGDEDLKRIQMYLDGLFDADTFLSFFVKPILRMTAADKKSLLEIMCSRIDTTSQLRENVLRREEFGGTCFGHGVAMPHPLYPMQEQTRIVLALLDRPLEWDGDNNRVDTVFLVSVQKDLPSMRGVWGYLGEMLKDGSFAAQLHAAAGDEEVLEMMRQKIKKMPLSRSDDFFAEE